MAGERFAPESVDLQLFHPKKRWRRVQELVQHFWKRWIREWLPTSNRRNKWTKEFKDLNKNGQTIILITHEDSIAKQSNRIITIMDGLIKSDLRE